MAVKKVITNLRIDEDEWLQVKTMAASQGISVNEYITRIIRMENIKEVLGRKNVKSVPKGYQALLDLAASNYKRKPMGASEDDKVVYGIEND